MDQAESRASLGCPAGGPPAGLVCDSCPGHQARTSPQGSPSAGQLAAVVTAGGRGVAPPVGVGSGWSLQAHSGRRPRLPQHPQARAPWDGWGLKSMDTAPNSPLCPHSCLCCIFYPPGQGIAWDASLPVFLGLEPLGWRLLPHQYP